MHPPPVLAAKCGWQMCSPLLVEQWKKSPWLFRGSRRVTLHSYMGILVNHSLATSIIDFFFGSSVGVLEKSYSSPVSCIFVEEILSWDLRKNIDRSWFDLETLKKTPPGRGSTPFYDLHFSDFSSLSAAGAQSDAFSFGPPSPHHAKDLLGEWLPGGIGGL